jgi:hypothetical protein
MLGTDNVRPLRSSKDPTAALHQRRSRECKKTVDAGISGIKNLPNDINADVTVLRARAVPVTTPAVSRAIP